MKILPMIAMLSLLTIMVFQQFAIHDLQYQRNASMKQTQEALKAAENAMVAAKNWQEAYKGMTEAANRCLDGKAIR